MKNIISHSSIKVNSICRRNHWAYQCGLWLNKSTTVWIFYARQVLEKEDCQLCTL